MTLSESQNFRVERDSGGHLVQLISDDNTLYNNQPKILQPVHVGHQQDSTFYF